jgi:hypothetical protein
MSIQSVVKEKVNDALRPMGVQMIRSRSVDPAIKTFIPARKTISAARKAGMSVGDFIDAGNDHPGATEETVQKILEFSELEGPVDCICEIGTGSGRYAEKLIDALHPARYESYETAVDWWPYLEKLPNLVTMPCDEHTLAPTPSASVQLVHANKVFVYLPFAAVAGYLNEMARVVRPGGTVAFDVVTEGCLDDRTVDSWIAARGSIYQPIPRPWVLNYMAAKELTLRGSWFVPMTGGQTELLVFRRDAPS